MKTNVLRTLLLSILISLAILGTSACAENAAVDDEPQSVALGKPEIPNTAGISPSCFQPVADKAIITAGDQFEGSAWNDPSVLYKDGKFIMYASSGSKNGDVSIYRLLSNDGIHWETSPKIPVLTKSASGWDSKNVETPSVVYFKGQYHMFYTGYKTSNDDAFDFKIGHAVSPDGIQWTRKENFVTQPTSPKGDPNFDFNQYITGEPGAIVYGDQLLVFFSAVGVNKDVGGTLQTIGLMTSSDGDIWSKPVSVLSPDQGLYPRSSDFVGFSTPSVIQIGNELHLFYDVAKDKPDWTQVKLAHAVSSDGGLTWTQDRNAIYKRGDFSWAKAEIRSPAPVQVGSDLYLYFAGHTDQTLGIGLAICHIKP